MFSVGLVSFLAVFIPFGVVAMHRSIKEGFSPAEILISLVFLAIGCAMFAAILEEIVGLFM